MRNFVTKMALMAVIMFVPSIVSAQFSPIGTVANDGGQFWDNRSQDGQFCNIGFVLNGTATAAGCVGDRPNTGFLPLDPITTGAGPLDLYKTTPGFGLFGNSATLTVYGDIAGQDRGWGWFTAANRTGSRVNLNGSYGNLGSIGGVGTPWGLWIQLTDESFAYSDDETVSGQFAFFKPKGFAGELLFGAEDINVLRGDSHVANGDRDFNDVSGRLEFTGGNLETVVPEPSTYVLMATGLLGIGFIRRRKQNA